MIFLSSLDKPFQLCYTIYVIGEDTHNKKRNSRNANQYKGATPIEKNVRVIDEQGNEYEATYPKRAKGLVKNGRARFIDEHTLCLACPPNEFTDNLEENIMEENKTLSVKDIFDAIGQLRSEAVYLNNALSTLSDIPSSGTGAPGSPGDIGAQAKATAIAEIISARETTNQQMLAFYQRMYDDIVNTESKTFAAKADVIQKCFRDLMTCRACTELDSEDKLVALGDLGERIQSLLSQLITEDVKPQ